MLQLGYFVFTAACGYLIGVDIYKPPTWHGHVQIGGFALSSAAIVTLIIFH